MNAVSPESVAAALAGAAAVSIISHVRPDADTIGSAFALGLGLSARGVDVKVSYSGEERLSDVLLSLPGAQLLVPEAELTAGPVAVAVDAASIGRLGALGAVYASSEVTVCIDHHVSNVGFADLDLIDPSADCTAILVLRVLDLLGTELTTDIATCLYAGLVTDTGSFKWARPESFLVAARLLEAGVDGQAWSRALLDSHPYSWLKLVSQVLDSAVLDRTACAGAGLVTAVVTAEQLAGMNWDESESIVDIVRTAREAEVSAVFKENRPESWTVSLRAKTMNVAPVAQQLGGGGHVRAAGYSDTGTAGEVVARLRELL